MGYYRNHSIVVSSNSDPEYSEKDYLKEAQEEAKRIFGKEYISEILGPFTNGIRSFFVAPDGSKEGWDTGDVFDKYRDIFTNALRASKGYLDWVEVQFGDDEHCSKVIRHSDDAQESA